MKIANREQSEQREGLKKILKTNNMIAFDIEKADKLTNSITRAEMTKKFILFAIIGMLGIIIVLALIIKLLR